MTTKRRSPTARMMVDAGIIVHGTHDLELARLLGYEYAVRELGYPENWEPPAGRQVWRRCNPIGPGQYGHGEWRFAYAEGTPGKPGSFPAVEFF